jgi:histidinol-phosphatase (PHP family)
MKRISLHGGHSGEFCDHARDTLAGITAAYHASGFECVGVTEHMPPLDDGGLYPDEEELGRTAEWMQRRFTEYVAEARRLQMQYQGRMRILVGMESEWYAGCGGWVKYLRKTYGLDYVVGSVHHVAGVCFDFSKGAYEGLAQECGGVAGLYAAYLDSQLEMLTEIDPEVVGHFDLIRLHDPDYLRTLAIPEIWNRVLRNLEQVRETGAVLDINARALFKGQSEAYVCGPILDAAASMGIPAAYGDDSHGISDVGCGFDTVAAALESRGMRGPSKSGLEILQSACR